VVEGSGEATCGFVDGLLDFKQAIAKEAIVALLVGGLW
jgi:hypothetical protein